MSTTTPEDLDAVASAEPGHSHNRWDVVAFRIATVAAVLPIIVAAFRDGIQGWYPALDAATTTLRSRDVLSAHPPLVGMWASISANAGAPTYFPGAIQLYLLTVPIHVFGNAWGTLLGMAALNSMWVLAAIWLGRRRLGTQVATLLCLAFALLVWTMGSELVVDISPMQMVTLPFAMFLVAVWSVADGDLVAIPILAFVANYLVLGHLVLTLLVPAIGLFAVIGLVMVLRRAHRAHPDTWPATKKQLKKSLGISALITVLLWVPSLIQQFTMHPGNLTNLWRASGSGLHRSLSFSQALQAVVSIIAVPPFWLRDSFTTQTIGSDSIDGLRIGLGIGVLVALVGLGILASRRRDRTTLALLGIALVALAASVVNITQAPSIYGFKRQYFRSMWGAAMFTWMAIVIAVVRSLPHREATGRPRGGTVPRLAAVGTLMTVLVAIAAFPHQDPGPGTNGTSPSSVVLARQVISPSVEALRGKGQVMVFAAGAFTSYNLSSSLILALATAGVDVCVLPFLVPQYGASRACNKGGPDLYVAVESAVFPARSTEKVIAEGTAMSKSEQAELSELGRKVSNWLATVDSLTVTPSVHAKMSARLGEAATREGEKGILDLGTGDLRLLSWSTDFAVFVNARSEVAPDGSIIPAVETGTFPAKDLVRWAQLVVKADQGNTVRIAIEQPDSLPDPG